MRTARLLACLTFALAAWHGMPSDAVAQTCTACWSDLDGDGSVGQADLGQLLANWGQEYPAAWYPDAYTITLWYLNGNGADFSGNGNDLTIKHDRVAWGADGDPCRKWAMMGDDPWEGGCENSDGGALTAPGAGCTYPGSGDWTVEAWVYFPSNTASYTVVQHYSEHWAGHDPYRLAILNGSAQFQINDSGNNTASVSADISAYKGQWIHLAGVYRYQQEISLWLGDGETIQLLATTPTALVIENLPDYDVYVGGTFCGTSTALKIDEVRISNCTRYLYDDFDDGDYDGWSVECPPWHPGCDNVEPPQVVASPEGFALRGTREGYTDPDWQNWLLYPFPAPGVGQLTIEMRAKSGPTWPNSVSLFAVNGTDSYMTKLYGEANMRAEWHAYVGGNEDQYLHDIGSMAYEWHTYTWTRDADGWWSLAIDGTVEAANFRQDSQLTTFDTLAIMLHRNESELEWLRVTAR